MKVDLGLFALIFLGLTIILLVVLLIQRERSSRWIIASSKALVNQERIRADVLRSRLDVILQLNRAFIHANDEETIIELILNEARKLTGAVGVSFVPFDERGQPKGTISKGDFPFALPDAWLEYLASPAVRQQCNDCKNYGKVMKDCPLVKGPFSKILGLYCLPLYRGDQELGVLNLYLPDDEKIGAESQEFLQSLVDETALALEGLYLRNRELKVLEEVHTIRHQGEARDVMHQLLVNLLTAIGANYVVFAAKGYGIEESSEKFHLEKILSVGKKLSRESNHMIVLIMEKIFTSDEKVKISALPIHKDKTESGENYIAVRLMATDEEAAGVLFAGRSGGPFFNEGQQQIFYTVANQMGLIIEAMQGIEKLRYQATMEERGRLAREIHDGLAQTLGFLKLQTAQMQNILNKGDYDKLHHLLKLSYSALAEAYQDAREAIDGLRVIGIGENGITCLSLDDALRQVIQEYQDNNMLPGIKVFFTNPAGKTDLSPEVVAQFIRILQEALSNVRKHSGADKIWISTRVNDQEMIIEIKDNGYGFAAEDVPETSRHGLKGMRERAELIGADFQVISRPGDGTTVSIRYPQLTRNKQEI